MPLIRAVINWMLGEFLCNLIAVSAKVNFRDTILGRTTLCLAARQGHEDEVEELALLNSNWEMQPEQETFDASTI